MGAPWATPYVRGGRPLWPCYFEASHRRAGAKDAAQERRSGWLSRRRWQQAKQDTALRRRFG